MEKYSSHQVDNEPSPEIHSRPNIDKLTGWLMNVSPERDKPKTERVESVPDQQKTEQYFDRKREVQDTSRALRRGGMVAVGEVLADKTTAQPHAVSTAGLGQIARQKKITEENSITGQPGNVASTNPTIGQIIQLGVVVGVGVGLLILLWLQLK